jgi:hypothetical protein
MEWRSLETRGIAAGRSTDSTLALQSVVPLKGLGKRGAFLAGSIREWRLSGTLGLLLSCVLTPAHASNAPPPPMPVHRGPINIVEHPVHSWYPNVVPANSGQTLAPAPVEGSGNFADNGSTETVTLRANATQLSAPVAANLTPTTQATMRPVSHTNAAHVHSTAHTLGTTNSSAGAFNLESSAKSFTLGSLGSFQSVTVDVGGKSEKVTLTTKLTAAEVAAADQVVLGGAQAQTLVVNKLGEATSGSLNLNAQSYSVLNSAFGNINSIVVPGSVQVIDGLAKISLSGDLINNGSILVQPGSGNSAVINAANITNAAGATITTGGTNHALDLTLNAAQNLTNAGTINSSGALNLGAFTLNNGSIDGAINAAPAIGVTAAAAAPAIGTTGVSAATSTITAFHNLNINAPNIINEGLLQSTGGNVNFTSDSPITIQQTASASVSARGSINVRDVTYAGSSNITINGGNYLSQDLNLNAGTGTLTMNVGNVTGATNVTAGVAHTVSNSPTLQLGNVNITGDPSFYNQGNIFLNGTINITDQVPLAIVASGNIISGGGGLITEGGDLTIIAGANFTTDDGTTSGGPAVTFGPDWTTVLSLTNSTNPGGGSKTGGFIDLTGGNGGTAPITSISTMIPGSVAFGNGGDVNIVAYAGTAGGSGSIILPAGVTILSGGEGLGTNGNVNIVGAAGTNSFIAVGAIATGSATGGSGQSGNVFISAATPSVVGYTLGGQTFPFQIKNGEPFGSFQFGAQTNGFVTVSNSITSIGTVTINTLKPFTNASGISASNINITTGGNFLQTNTGGLNAGQGISLTANVQTDLEGTSSGGLGGFSISMTGVNPAVFVGASPGAATKVTGAGFTVVNASQVIVNGSVNTTQYALFSNGGGSIVLSGSGVVDTSSFTLSGGTNATQINTLAIGVPNQFTYSAGNTLTLPMSGLTGLAVNPDPTTGNGGAVNLSFSAFNYTNMKTQPFIVTANAGGSGTVGGTINIINNSTITEVIGPQAQNFELIASSTNSASAGGAINFTTLGTLIVNPAIVTLNNNSLVGSGVTGNLASGGTLNFVSNPALIITNSLNEIGTKNAGSISLSTTSALPFVVGATSTPTNGILGSIIGGNVTITNSVGITTNGSASGFIKATEVDTTQAQQKNIILNTALFTNNGALVVDTGQGGIIVDNANGSLTLAGHGSWSSPYALNFTAFQNVNLGPLFVSTPTATLPQFSSLSVLAGNAQSDTLGVITLGVSSLHAAAASGPVASGTGGIINLQFSSIVYPGQANGPLVLITNAGATTPGSITVQKIIDTTPQTIGTGAGNFEVQASNGGSVTFVAPGNLTVNASAPSLVNPGGNLTLLSGGNLLVLGSLNQGAGNISLASVGTSSFTVGVATTNGVTGGVIGNTVTLTNPIEINIFNGSSVVGNTTTLVTPHLNNSGLLQGVALNVLAGNSNLTITDATGTGKWGSVGNKLVLTGAQISMGPLLAANGDNDAFDQLTIAAGGLLSIGASSLSTDHGDTGLISISAFNINYLAQAATPMLLDASSADGGGTINLIFTGGLPSLVVGPNPGQFIVNTSSTAAMPSSQNAGNITLSNSGGNVAVVQSALHTNDAANAKLNTNLTALAASTVLFGSGNPATGWSPLILGPTGNLTIDAPGSTVFVLGTLAGFTTTNGIVTSVPVTGGSLNITAAGGFNITGKDFLQGAGNSGSVTITGGASIVGPLGIESITAPTINLVSNIGSVGLNGNPIIVNTPAGTTASTISLNAATLVNVSDNSAGFAATGTPTITIASASAPTYSLTAPNAPLTVTNGINAGNVTLISAGKAGGLITTGTIGTGAGGVVINVGTNSILQQLPTDTIQAAALNITAGATVNLNPDIRGLQVFTPYLAFAGNTVSNSLPGFFGFLVDSFYGPTTLGPVSANAGFGEFDLISTGSTTISAPQTASRSYDLDIWGTTFVNSTVNAPISAFVMRAGAPLIASGPASVITGNSISFDSDANGNVVAFVNSSGGLFISTTGAVSVNNISTGGAWGFADSFTYQSFALASPQPFSVSGNITTTNGSIVLTETGANSLTLSDGLDLQANGNGNILINTTSTAAGAAIAIGKNATLEASSNSPFWGFVNVSIGPTPFIGSFTNQPQAGITPGNVTVNSTGGGQVFFGSTLFPNDTITAAAGSVLNAAARNILFNANGNAASITLSGGSPGTTITADPPVSATVNVVPGGINSFNLAALTLLMPANLNGSLIQNREIFDSSNSVGSPVDSRALVLPKLSSIEVGSTSSLSNLLSANFSSVPQASSFSAIQSLGLTNQSYGIRALSVTETTTEPVRLNQANLISGASAAAALSDTDLSARDSNQLSGAVTKSRKILQSQHCQGIVSRDLEKGATILAPESDTVVQTPFGRVEVAARSLVLIVAEEHSLSVYNLHDNSRNSVVIKTDAREIDVFPGRHVTLTSLQTERFETVNPALSIPHRSMKLYQITDDLRAFESEFHIPSAIARLKPLHDMVNSTDHKKRKMAQQVLKTAAILQIMSASSEQFQVLALPVTAFNN